jgi:hypothetical protein
MMRQQSFVTSRWSECNVPFLAGQSLMAGVDVEQCFLCGLKRLTQKEAV